MPSLTSRNEQIRNRAAEYPRYWTQRGVATQLAAEYGLSPITVANVMRGRDLQPRNRSGRRAVAQADRALGLNRRFGVEIEFYGIDRAQVQAWLNTGAVRGWRVKSDGSVNGRVDGRHWYGLELVSPPLSGEAGLESLRIALQWLRENGARVNSTCGLHVHHDASDIGARGIARVVRAYHQHQSLLNWLVAPSRREGTHYAKQLTGAFVSSVEASAANGTRYLHRDRYYAVNVCSFAAHGTLEVRQHQGTLSFRKIEAWIRLGQGLMDAAAEVRTVSSTGLRGLLEQLRVDEDSAAFLMGRALQFGAPVASVA